MATLNINGRTVTVDDSFLSLPADQQNATVEEIASSFGAPAAEKPSVAMDVAKSAGSGLVKGAAGVAGLVGDAAGALGRFSDAGGDYIARKLGFEGSAPLPNFIADNAGAERIGRAIDKVAGAPVTSYQPQTTAGKYAKTAGEFVPGAMIGPGGAARNALMYGVIPGLTSEAAGQATEGTKLEPIARVAGALAGVALPGLARRAVTPLPISQERQALVDTLRREGVEVSAGQSSGNKALRYAEGILGESPGAGGGAARLAETQGEQFTSAAMRRAGADGLATPGNMAANADRLGQQFRDLSARNTLVADPQLGQELGQTLRQYDKVLKPDQRSIVGAYASEIVERISQGGGKMPGDEYQTIRSRLGKSAFKNKGDGEFSDALDGLKTALDNNMARSISPDDAAAWQNARREYGNMKTLEKAATGAGEVAATGVISPAQMRNAAVVRDRSGYARGQGDFAELARAGTAIMTPLPNSGTAQRLNIAQMLGAGAGGATGGVPGAIVGAALPGVAGRVLHSRPVQSYLGNQLLAGQGATPQEIVAQALLASRSASAPAPR